MASSELVQSLVKLLDTKDDKNYDPRMEELMRSDRLIDPTNECLSNLEDDEIFHISKIRGSELSFKITMKQAREIYNRPDMLGYHCGYMDYIRSADPSLDGMEIGGLPMTNRMISELIKLRRSKEGWAAKLYADSIKQAVANTPLFIPQQPEEESGGIFGWVKSLFAGRKQQSSQYGNR